MTRRRGGVAAPPAPAAADPVQGAPLPPAWGWKMPFAGRAAYVAPGVEYQGTSIQVCGLFPFVASAGTPQLGTPIGRHQLHNEVACCDPLAWQRGGLITNPGMFVLGEPGTGKSTFVKRLAAGAIARGNTVLVPADPRPDYTALAEAFGGQVIRVGRGMDAINPLDAGPLGTVLPQLPAGQAGQLRAEVRARRLALLLALCTLIRGGPIGNAEEVVLGRAVDLISDRIHPGGQPTVPDVLAVIEQGPDQLRAAARADSPAQYQDRVAALTFTLDLLVGGTLAGVFDRPTSTPINLAAPIVTVDISRAGASGDKLLTAAMLSSWAYGYAVTDAAAVLAAHGLAEPRSYLTVLDELWRALRGAPGLVEHADTLTRLNRARGMASIMITHSLADLDALPTDEDRAKARGFIDRSAITVLAALPPRELAQVHQITPLTGPERDLVASWSASDSWRPGARHPGRGHYLIKTGGRIGIPIEMSLTPLEQPLYDTDQAIRGTAVTEVSP